MQLGLENSQNVEDQLEFQNQTTELIIKGVLFKGEWIRFSEFVKNVGVWLVKNLSMNINVNKISSNYYKILKDIGKVRENLQKGHHRILYTQL